MKTRLCSAALLAAFAAFGVSASACAEPGDSVLRLKPYVGIDLQRYHMSYADDEIAGIPFNWGEGLEDNIDGVNIHVGSRLHKNFGLELGYFRTKEEGKTFDIGLGTPMESKLRLQGVTLDALGYLPVTESGRLELIGTAGVSYTWADVKLDTGALGLGTVKDDDREFGFRAGAGAQFNLTDSVGLRGLARYQSADFDNTADRAWVYSLGVNYSF